MDTDNDDDSQNYWYTTVGKFKFAVKDLPQPLQYIYQLLQVRLLHHVFLRFFEDQWLDVKPLLKEMNEVVVW